MHKNRPVLRQKMCLIFAFLLFRCTLLAHSSQASDSKPLNDDRIYISTTNSTERNYPMPVYLTRVKNGKVGDAQKIYTFPAPTKFIVSPSTRYLLWEGGGTEFPSLNIVDLLGKSPAIHIPNCDLNLISWSPEGDIGLFLTKKYISWKDGNAGVAFGETSGYWKLIVLNLKMGTLSELSRPKGGAILAAYWSLTGEYIVYSGVSNDVLSARVPTNSLDDLVKFYSVEPRLEDGDIRSREIKALTVSEIDKLLGNAVLPLLHFGERKETMWYAGIFPRLMVASISPHGDRALLFGHAIHKQNPLWATADKELLYVSNDRKIYTLTINCPDERSSFFWSSTGKWVSFLASYNEGSDSAEVLLDTVTGHEVYDSLGRIQGIVTQILPCRN